MDIVTHAMMGVIVASPFAEKQPMAAAAFVMGSVLPDLDAFSRCFGKRAFLRFHQTQSHGLPNALLAAGLLWLLVQALDWVAPWAALGLALGLVFHSVLDYSNTYGITLFAPFSRRRYCAEWVFFIDAVVIVASVAALLASGNTSGKPVSLATLCNLATASPCSAIGASRCCSAVAPCSSRRRERSRCCPVRSCLGTSSAVPDRKKASCYSAWTFCTAGCGSRSASRFWTRITRRPWRLSQSSPQ